MLINELKESAQNALLVILKNQFINRDNFEEISSVIH